MNIHFLYPNFLFALSAIAIPIIIHLFNFRRYKTIYFSNLKFLKDIKLETQSQSRLKHLLALLARILTIACLVFAFAQPFIPSEKSSVSGKQGIVGIYADNSFSMEAESKYGKLLDVAKNKVKEISEAYRPETRYFFITGEYDPRNQHIVNCDQLIENSLEVRIRPFSRMVSDIISRQADFIETAGENAEKSTLYLISDFQKNSTDLKKVKDIPNVTVNLIPLSTQPTNNLYIDSCWFETPSRKYNQPEELNVRIVNRSNESYLNTPIKLYINDSVKAIGSFNITENATVSVTLTYSNSSKGMMNGKVVITDYPITYDNTFYFSYTIAENVNVLAINHEKESPYLNALFNGDNYIALTNYTESNINYSSFPTYNTIILNELNEISSGLAQELKEFVTNGGSLVIFPGDECKTETFNNLSGSLGASGFGVADTHRIKIAAINYQDPVYKNVFLNPADKVNLPVITFHYKLQSTSKSAGIALWTAENREVMLSSSHSGKGTVYVFAFPLSEKYSNLARHPVFVPTIYNIALFSIPSGNIYYTIGKEEEISIPILQSESESVFHIINNATGYDFIPEHRLMNGSLKLYAGTNITEAGNYVIKNNGTVISGAAFNYNRTESDLACYTQEELKEQIENAGLKSYNVIDVNTPYLTKTLKELSRGTQLWKLFLLLALFFIGAEIAILRLWR